MNRADIIQSIINKKKSKTYLEIGVQRAKNFFTIKASRKIAVDPQFKIGIKRRLKNLGTFFQDHFYEMTSDDFFTQEAPTVLKSRKLDVALIDGLHTYEQVMKDFDNCLQYLNPDGLILFHDCNPVTREAAEYAHSPEEIMKKYPGKTPEWNGDVWKAIVHIQALYSDIDIFVLDCDYGVGVARRSNSVVKNLNLSIEQIRKLNYDDLDRDRVKLLNLKPVAFWSEYVKSI
jgi:hypothetical protein